MTNYCDGQNRPELRKSNFNLLPIKIDLRGEKQRQLKQFPPHTLLLPGLTFTPSSLTPRPPPPLPRGAQGDGEGASAASPGRLPAAAPASSGCSLLQPGAFLPRGPTGGGGGSLPGPQGHLCRGGGPGAPPALLPLSPRGWQGCFSPRFPQPFCPFFPRLSPRLRGSAGASWNRPEPAGSGCVRRMAEHIGFDINILFGDSCHINTSF